MALKYSGNINELCYPFIYEESPLCDYEILTDELCAVIGGIITELEEGECFHDIHQFLQKLQPLIFDLNGSIRGKQAIYEAEILKVSKAFERFQQEIEGQIKGFVLPRGGRVVQELHRARSLAKKTIRALVRVDAQSIKVPDELHRFANLLCNLFFCLTVVINRRLGIIEPEYLSRSYKKP